MVLQDSLHIYLEWTHARTFMKYLKSTHQMALRFFILVFLMQQTNAMSQLEWESWVAQVHHLYSCHDVKASMQSGFLSIHTNQVEEARGFGAQGFVVDIPLHPGMSNHGECLIGGCSMDAVIGVAVNGVPILSPFTEKGCEVMGGNNRLMLDSCGGHHTPTLGYHYHTSPKCLFKDGEVEQVIGMAIDGYPIMRNALSDDGGHIQHDHLDNCHGIMSHGFYKYIVLTSFPYMIGCMKGNIWNSSVNVMSSNTMATSDMNHGIGDTQNGNEEMHHGDEEMHHGTDEMHHGTEEMHHATAAMHHGTDEMHHGTKETAEETHHGNGEMHHETEAMVHNENEKCYMATQVRPSVCSVNEEEEVHHIGSGDIMEIMKSFKHYGYNNGSCGTYSAIYALFLILTVHFI
ncbi:unnamed protein product [Owenia fusiformis]|uniref:YHYH domain-containing protein n=1 Tax=Owenia fusiformis TaxID=6347 RepID=A0A8S4PVW8_OWEFU|nr:unnamed protein product [Owenia fusiformis]